MTMATVGYGDFYPRTHMGRVTGVAVSIIGMISCSLFVVFLQQLIEFNPKEQKVRNTIINLEIVLFRVQETRDYEYIY